MDEDILELVADHDQAFEADLVLDDSDVIEEEAERPRTADKGEQHGVSWKRLRSIWVVLIKWIYEDVAVQYCQNIDLYFWHMTPDY